MKNFIINISHKVKENLLNYHRKINWYVFCFIFCFTIGAWLDINGLWCELPIMVHELPEKWKLPSILGAATQIAQIGPVVFLVGRKVAPKVFSYVNTIYVILGIGALSCFLLSFLWNKTAVVFGSEYSVGLIVLNFSLALLDGTSSVTFMPYIGLNFVKEYMIPNYIGESLAALIPSVLSLIQGLGQDPGCRNTTDAETNQTILIPNDIVPNYSVSVYFLLMFSLLCISTTAFSLLNFSKVAINERKYNKSSKSGKGNIEEKNENAIKNDPNNNNVDQQNKNNYDLFVDSQTPLNTNSSDVSLVGVSNNNKELALMYGFTFFLSFFCYGALPAVQSYSTLPYGNDVFYYAVNLSFVFLPLSIVFSIWSYEASILQISIEYAFATAFGVYIIVISCFSPCPPFLGIWLGPFLSVASWILVQSMYMRIRCLIAARLERFGQRALLTIGFLTMIGQIFGGLIFFLLVNVYEVFKSKEECATDFHEYCK